MSIYMNIYINSFLNNQLLFCIVFQTTLTWMLMNQYDPSFCDRVIVTFSVHLFVDME